MIFSADYDQMFQQGMEQGMQLSGGTMTLSFGFGLLSLIAMWKLFTKAGEAGWKAIIPFYNLYTLTKIVYGNGWKFLFMLVPILSIVYVIMLYVRLGQRFGKSAGFIIGLLFLSPIFELILAFDNSYYQGPHDGFL